MSCHSLCVSHRVTSNPTGRWWFQPPMELFQHVRSILYLLKVFGILYVLIQPGHKYCVLFGCVCVRSISAQTFETGVFMFELRLWIVCVWLCAVWVSVCTFHLSSNIRDRGLYVWAELVNGLRLCGSLSQSLTQCTYIIALLPSTCL